MIVTIDNNYWISAASAHDPVLVQVLSKRSEHLREPAGN